MDEYSRRYIIQVVVAAAVVGGGNSVETEQWHFGCVYGSWEGWRPQIARILKSVTIHEEAASK